MNWSSADCQTNVITVSYLTSTQVLVVVLLNTVLMVGNIIANGLVIYILIKTKQVSNITCKLIFMLSISGLMIGAFAQNLCTIHFYEKNCFVKLASISISTFLSHLSAYVIATLGIDRYLRIKCFTNFKTLWKTKVVFILICFASLLAAFQAVIITISWLLQIEQITMLIYVAMDATIVGTTIFLQIRTIQRSNTVHNESTLSASRRTNKKITRFSMRIMFLQGIFIAPYTLIVNFLRDKIQDQLNSNGKSVLEFITCISIVLIFANSFANSILFLMTNVKARKILHNFAKSLTVWVLWKISLQHVLSVTYDKKMNFHRFVFTNFCHRLITYWIINVKLIRLRTRKPKRYNKPNSSNGATAPILLKFKVMKTLKEKATFNYSYDSNNFSAHLHSKQFKPVKTGVLHRNCYFSCIFENFWLIYFATKLSF